MIIDIDKTDRDRVEAAIKQEESRTSAEIVVVVASQSDDYIHVPIHIAAAVALAVPLVLPLFASFMPWSALPLRWVFVAQLLVFIVTAMLLSLDPLRYHVTPSQLMRKYARRFASAEFLAVNIHSTRGRSGMLIFVSLLERHVEIITDLAIARKMPDSVWQQVIGEMVPMLRAGQLNEALVHGVTRSGNILAEPFPASAQNPNELSDRVIVIDAEGRRDAPQHRPENEFGTDE